MGASREGGVHPERAGRERLSEHDDREGAVPFGNVPRVPRRAPGGFGKDRYQQLGRHQDQEYPGGNAMGDKEKPRHPARLDHRYPGRIAQGGGAAGRVRYGRPHP